MSQPSGWYDDPQDPDYLRYFDGVTWTDHRSPRRAPQVDQSRIGDGAHVEDFRRQGGRPDAGSSGSPYVVRPDEPAPGHGWKQPPLRGYGDEGQNGPAGASPQGWQGSYQTGPYQPSPPGSAQHPARPGDGQPPALTADGQPLAGWWRRAGALLIDALVLALVLSPIYSRLLGDWIPQISDWWGQTIAAGDPQNVPDPPMPDPGPLARATFAGLAVYLVYEIGALALWGRTLGRAAVGISVRTVEEHRRVPVGRLIVRTVVKRLGDVLPIALLGFAFQLLDVLFPLWDRPLRQALHDKAGRTCVVRGRLPRGAADR